MRQELKNLKLTVDRDKGKKKKKAKKVNKKVKEFSVRPPSGHLKIRASLRTQCSTVLTVFGLVGFMTFARVSSVIILQTCMWSSSCRLLTDAAVMRILWGIWVAL